MNAFIGRAARIAVLTGALSLSTWATAGTLVVSGDSNIGNSIDGSNGATLANNGIFFKNLIGSGTSVVFQNTTNADASETASAAAIKTFYSGLGDQVTSISTPVTSANLSGASLYIGFLQDTPYSAASISAINSFLVAGGTVLLTGEFPQFDSTVVANDNALLSALGSGLSLTQANLDLTNHVATGSQIVANPLTANVNSFGYAATTGVAGGTALFKTLNGTTFMAVENFPPVPEPGTWAMSLAGMVAIGLTVARRRRLADRID